MTEKKDLHFTIDNTGGVSHAELELRAGVNVLKGKNGAGKTSCIDAVVRASGGKVPLQRKDGTEEGRVVGPGVSLSVKGVVRSSGRAELVLADVGPLGRLIDPRLKDSKAAARERVRALVELLDLGIDDKRLLTLCAGDRQLFALLAVELDENAIDDLLDASEKLRHMLHAFARKQEDRAAQAEAEVETTLKECRDLLETLGGADGLSVIDVPQAEAELEAAIRAHDRAIGQCEARESLEGKQNEIRESLGVRPDLEGAKKAQAQAAAEVKDRWEKVLEIRDREAEARRQHTAAEITFEAAERKAEECEKALTAWKRQNEVLEEKPIGPSRAEVEKTHGEKLQAVRKGHKRAGLTQTFKEKEKAHDVAVLDGEQAQERAERYRELAAEIPAKLGGFLAEAGAPGLTVYDGRLHVTAEGETPRDFEHRCSTGERARAALRVAAQVYRGRVLALDGEVWSGLDPENRAEFAQAAQEHDLCVITEEAAEGELRMELRPGAETTIGGE